jgi:hypothetical protein
MANFDRAGWYMKRACLFTGNKTWSYGRDIMRGFTSIVKQSHMLLSVQI